MEAFSIKMMFGQLTKSVILLSRFDCASAGGLSSALEPAFESRIIGTMSIMRIHLTLKITQGSYHCWKRAVTLSN